MSSGAARWEGQASESGLCRSAQVTVRNIIYHHHASSQTASLSLKFINCRNKVNDAVGQARLSHWMREIKNGGSQPDVPYVPCICRCKARHVIFFCISMIVRSVEFDSYSNIVNLSRVDPATLSTSQNSVVLHGNLSPVTCLSLIRVTESHLDTPKQMGSLDRYYKGITGIMLSYEWERMVSVIGMIYSMNNYYGPIYANTVSFSTKASSLSSSKPDFN